MGGFHLDARVSRSDRECLYRRLRTKKGKEAIGMNRSLFRAATYVQLVVITLLSTGCAPTQPFFLNEGPNLSHYLDKATQIEYPDVEVASLAETTEAHPPLALGNHEYQFWDVRLEECIAMALQNSKFMITVSGVAEQRPNVLSQFVSGTADQFGSVFDVARQQSLTQSIPLTVDGNGNRVLARGVQNANQIGGVEDALAEFDAQVSTVFSYSTTDRPRNIDQDVIFSRQLFQGRDGLQQSAISKRLATGGVVTVREQLQYSANNLEVGGGNGRDVASDWTAVLEAQMTHPLMRGRGTLVNRIPIVLASLNEDISIAEFEGQIRNLVRDVEVLYWDLYCAYRNVETEIVGRDSALVTARQARLNLEGGKASIQDLRRAETRYYQFRSRLQGSLAGSNVAGSDPRGVYGIERELRARMGLSPTDGRLIRPIDEPTIAHVDFDWFESSTVARMRSPEIRRSRIALKQRELEIMQAKNQLLPQVDLTLVGRLVGVGDELGLGSRNGINFPDPAFDQGAVGSQAIGALTEGNFAELSARVEITPAAIGQRRELARIRNAKLDHAHQQAFVEEQELVLTNLLSEAIAKLETHYQQIQTNAAALNSAESEVEARIDSYNADREEVNFVLDAQLSRANAQNDYFRSICEYNKSICYIHYLRGTLLDFNSIAVEEGPWPQKAYWDALERARERSAGYHYRYGHARPDVVRTGTEPLLSVGDLEPMPGALPPHGIADAVILGQTSIDEVGEALKEMPTLQMPEPPAVETESAAPAKRLPATGRVSLTLPSEEQPKTLQAQGNTDAVILNADGIHEQALDEISSRGGDDGM